MKQACSTSMQILTSAVFAVTAAIPSYGQETSTVSQTPADSFAAAGELLAGTGREDITPPAGFPNRTFIKTIYDGVLSPLYARALVLGDGTRKIALLQWDLIDTRVDAVAKVRRLMSAAIGVPESSILVTASHSHSSPSAPCDDVTQFPIDENHTEPANQATALNKQWTEQLFSASVKAAIAANKSLQPVTLEVGRASVPEWQFNRRARRPDGTVETIFVPVDPYTMPAGLRFGPMDPTLTILVFKDQKHSPAVTLFNYPCHAVSIYTSGITYKAGAAPSDFTYIINSKAVSADWPGYATEQIETRLGGQAIFLQGCAGDLVPARRGTDAAKEMGALFGSRAAAAAARGLPIAVKRLEVNSCRIGLPLSLAQRTELGKDLEMVEVQVFVLGSVAIVALPGEPMIEIAMAIQKKSPYPHTVVLGYSNGGGIQYVGVPGELARGGYGADKVAYGTDECGTILVDTSIRLLREIAVR
jgi:hypothetical protein